MKKFMQIGLLRGLVFQIIWTALGAGFVSGIRALMGLWVWRWDEVTFGFSGGAWVFGGVRLISSARMMFEKIGPLMKRNSRCLVAWSS